MITPEQIRAARALLRIEQDELARRARVSTTTIRRIEAVDGANRVSDATLGTVKHALEEAGAEFIDDGVRGRGNVRGREAKYEALRAIAERSAALHADAPPVTDTDLYDDDGLPA